MNRWDESFWFCVSFFLLPRRLAYCLSLRSGLSIRALRFLFTRDGDWGEVLLLFSCLRACIPVH